MSDPKTDWGEFYRKNKVAILIGAGVVIALSLASGDGSTGGGGDRPVVIAGDTIPSGDSGRSVEDWQRDQDRQQEQHEEFVESVIREEQTCSNGKVISIHETCPEE